MKNNDNIWGEVFYLNHHIDKLYATGWHIRFEEDVFGEKWINFINEDGRHEQFGVGWDKNGIYVICGGEGFPPYPYTVDQVYQQLGDPRN